MLKQGIYEKVIDSETKADMDVAESEDLFCQTEEMDASESPKILADYLAGVIRKKLEDIEKLNDRVKLVNNIFASCGIEGTEIVDDEKLLMEVMTHQRHLLQAESNSTTIRPLSGFRVSNLFTGGTSVLSIGEEIRREIATADRITFIVSFLKLSGVRIMIDDLMRFCEQKGKTLRLITTTYCGITEAKALQQLSELTNTEIRISYNTKVERLHAKAYIFERNSGMNTAYIGSSNLSKSAQTDGLEWNVRVTSEENPHIIKTALATFDMYWNSPNFEDFRVGGIDKFNEELDINNANNNSQLLLQHFSLQPFQKQILDKLKVEREELGNNRNLVVAATGTGKTVMSAFDYLSFCSNRGARNKRLLYIAHREEILLQSLNTYRSVMRNPNFGVLWVGNYTPQDETEYEYLFLSVSMFNSRFEEVFSKLDTDYYAYIVVDEAHHSQANSYRQLFSHFTPEILLGLTATPERMDGKDLRPDFGGHISAEMRLPNALQAGLLTPFQYLCVTDNTDLRDDALWNGKYIADRLANRLCREERATNIVNALDKYLLDVNKCRALCFCVNKKHAEYMADQFNSYGLKAKALTADTHNTLRRQYANNLRDGELNYLCVVDVFNEGVDLPEVDTVLFLRPTESLTIFLQQLGRGLRLYPGKTELTVLDFVAQVNKKYDYAGKFRALSLRPDKNVAKQVENGFTFLPCGCNIVMEKMARQYVLDNIRGAIFNSTHIVNELRMFNDTPTIEQFLESNGQDIRILYHKNCWSSLKRAANKINYADDYMTHRLESNIKNLIHHNTASFLHFVRDFINGSDDYRKEEYVKFSTMLYYDLFAERINNTNFKDIYEALEKIHDKKYLCFKEEISQVVNYLIEHLNIQTEPLGNEVLPGVELYGCYTREEIFTLTGRQTPTRRMQGAAAGVFNLPEYNATLLFVTLNKSDKDFSPSTQYDDYVIDETHFHWQSQNKDSHSNRGGQVYTLQPERNNKIILFVREEKTDVLGTSPFHCFGLVNYVESWGDEPMNVKWRMVKPIMPLYLKVV